MNLTHDQDIALYKIGEFLKKSNTDNVFVLRGSAGTGKTTILKDVLDSVPAHLEETQLCALTNKAARVLGRKTSTVATTLHKCLYKIEDADDKIKLIRRMLDPETPHLFIVDEASMMGDRIGARSEIFESRPLLSDLLEYVLQSHPDNKLILCGDPCQLPPIGYDINEPSPALDINYLQEHKKLRIASHELKEVVRQEEGSIILDNAVILRDEILYNKAPTAKLKASMLDGTTNAIRKYMSTYDDTDETAVMLLAWTNDDVNWWNTAIRERLYLHQEDLAIGTRMVVDRNWSNGEQYLTKGESCSITEVDPHIRHFAGLSFQEASIQTVDMDGVVSEWKTLVSLDHLKSHKGLLEREQEKNLVHEAMKMNPSFREYPMPWNDPYVGALRLRYGYALTCHKAQGSEFNNLILHPYYPRDDKRWLYTAITRAKQELYSYKRA